MATYASDPVLFKSENGARIISLNRPEKLNALSSQMISMMEPRLAEYAKLASASMVILTSTSPRALCAGGDVLAVVTDSVKGHPQNAARYFRDEYNLDYLIATFSKPYVALMDGITFGGGLGLCMHAPFRVATERTKVAMPEMDIGFFPDVGSSFFLSRLDDYRGFYYALTGKALSGVDSYFAGFATHYVPLDRIGPLISRLLALLPSSLGVHSALDFFALVNVAINEFSETALPKDYSLPHSAAEIHTIANCFSQPSVEDILNALRADGSKFALETCETLEAKPMSLLKLSLELLQRATKKSIKAQFESEVIAATNLLAVNPKESDFVAGVSHKIINKIRDPPYPAWSGELSNEWINKMLLPSDATKDLPQPLLNTYFNIDYNLYPHHMGLPTNSNVQAFICGTDGLNRKYLPTPSEVITHFSRTFPKFGVKQCVQQILDVHGQASTYDNKYVSWK